VVRFWLNSDRAGTHAVTVTLQGPCGGGGGLEVPSDEVDVTRFDDVTTLPPRAFTALRTYVFPGGCATYRFAFARGVSSTLAVDMDAALSFVSRASLVEYVAEKQGLTLCGTGATCPG
jgi:hypothetical protein